MISEKDWIILLTIHQEQNITKAAERLYTTQPAITYRLQQLEKYFGAQIVTRGNKGVEFTLQGEYLVEHAKSMLAELRKAKEHVLNMGQDIKGTLRLGVASTYARYKLPLLLKNFLRKHPNVEIHLKTGWSTEIEQLLNKEEIHIGIVRNNFQWKEQKLLLSKEPLCVVSADPVNLDILPQLMRIHYDTDQSLKASIDQWWRYRFAQPPTITMEVDRIDTCKEMVLHGLGYAILPSCCLNESDRLHTVDLTINDQKPLLRETWVIYRNSVLELAVVKAFTDFLLTYAPKNNMPPSIEPIE